MSVCFSYQIRHDEFLEWPAEERAKALAYKTEESLTCSMCGTAEWEWEEDRFAYEPMEKICRGCELKDLVSTEHRPGKFTILRPRR